jgi:sugar lactone lactonase YvrE
MATAGLLTTPTFVPAPRLHFAWSAALPAGTPSQPIALAVDRHGQLYVADARSHQIHKFDADGGFLMAWGGEGSDAGQFRFADARLCADLGACAPSVIGLTGGGLAVDGDGAVYVADWANHRIQKFTDQGRLLARWGHFGSAPGSFFLPGGIAVDGQGHVYVLDTGNQRVQRFDRDGRLLGQWGGQGTGAGQFMWPTGLAVDGLGTLWVVDLWDHRVQTFDSRGQRLTEWAAGSSDQREFGDVPSLAVDQQGWVYVTGTGPSIALFAANGQRLGSWNRDGSDAGQLARAGGLAVDGSGGVYVADRDTGRLHKFQILRPVTS